MPNSSKYILTENEINSLKLDDFIPKDSIISPCGCGVKMDLDQIVYPVIKEIENELGTYSMGNISKRRDSFFINKELTWINRKYFTPEQIPEFENFISNLAKSFVPLIYTELFSSEINQVTKGADLERFYKTIQKDKFELMNKYFRPNSTNQKIEFAKGHSIQSSTNFFLHDYFESGEEIDRYSCINNDTFITADSVLSSYSPASVFTAFNNALNDLFIYGATEDIHLFPVYDCKDKFFEKFNTSFELYQEYCAQREIQLKIHPTPPLHLNSNLIGATVKAKSPCIPIQYSNLKPGDQVLITHQLGDLALLSIHRSSYFNSEICPTSIKGLRKKILTRMSTPNFQLAEIVSSFLPKYNQLNDPAVHLSFISDISGPGLSVIEEACQYSQVNLKINNLELVDNNILNFYRRNYTSSTNGPWIITGRAQVIDEIIKMLKKFEINEYFILGEILENSKAPVIFIENSLREKYSVEKYKYDIFNPVNPASNSVQLVFKNHLFKNYQFV